MVTVKVKTVNNTIDVFNTESYVIGPKVEMHPAILDVRVYAGSRCIFHRRRWFQKIYKKFLYKPLQTEQKQGETTSSK